MRSHFVQITVFLLLLQSMVFAHDSFATGVADAGRETQLQQWLSQSHDMQLAVHPTWLALLHVKQGIFSVQGSSQVDDDAFFLSGLGRFDPGAELAADLAAFAQPSGPGHAQCRFPARWWWLKQQLQLGDEHDVSCPLFANFMTRIASDRLYLVFPSMYLNNPGSTFGHTFLRFDDNDDAILLSQTLNYAARVGESDHFIEYVSRGLLGGYAGYYRARPYFEMVQEYSNIENRDIWEYRLDFTPEEIMQLVRHVWEVKDIRFDYFFLKENCAYRLLALIDVMRPELQLTGDGRFPLYAIPVDTVRALDDRGLIASREYRPSLATQIDARVKLIIDADDMGLEPIMADAAPDTLIWNMLDAGYLMMQFHGQANTTEAQQLLSAMHTMSADRQEQGGEFKLSPVVAPDASPETGHKSARLSAGYGKQNSQSYIDLKLRPAFHEPLDSPAGYIAGTGINVLDAHLKWFYDEHNMRLESLSLVNVSSLNFWSAWRRPLSWRFDIRFDHTQLDSMTSVRNFISRGALGISTNVNSIMPYLFMTAEGNFSSHYDKGYSLLGGIESGIYILSAGQWQVSVKKEQALSGAELGRLESIVAWQIGLAVNHAVRFQYRLTRYDFFNDEDWSAGYHYYF
jgi:hypothetical protein